MTPDEIIRKIGTCDEIVEIATTPARLFILIGHLQVALRHPENTGASADFAREMTNNLARVVCHYVPEAQELIDQGWNPAYDTTREYFNLEFLSPTASDFEGDDEQM